MVRCLTAGIASRASTSACGRREQSAQATFRIVDRLTVLGGQPGPVGAGGRGRDLLPEHSPDRHLGAIHCAWHATARGATDRRAQPGLLREL